MTSAKLAGGGNSHRGGRRRACQLGPPSFWESVIFRIGGVQSHRGGPDSAVGLLDTEGFLKEMCIGGLQSIRIGCGPVSALSTKIRIAG